MSIRKHNKDHLKQLATSPELVSESATRSPESDDPLRFWTIHEKPTFVDLTVFADGELQPSRPGGSWLGPFSGRPELIAQLAPSIRSLVEYLAPDSVQNYTSALRAWWRLFHRMEAVAVDSPLRPVADISDLTELHRQRAFDEGLSALNFRFFLRIVDLALKVHKRPPLYWTTPGTDGGKRHLPPPWQVDEIRFELKHAWFRALHRWQKANELLRGDEPLNSEERRLRKNYRRFRMVAKAAKLPRPSAEPIYGNVPRTTFTDRGYSVSDMLRGFYPDSYDIRVAFHLCLANTGWNAAVLLDLDVNQDIVEPHPKDPSRYLLRGNKNRGHSEHVSEGLFKSQGSAGVILQTLIARTQPLREHLMKELNALKLEYGRLHADGASEALRAACWKRIASLEQGVRSPWLYVTPGTTSVEWLASTDDYSRGLTREVRGGFLAELITNLNARQPSDKQISMLKAGDFRDAFAGYAYRVSGGMVLYVMKVLRHKHLKTTLAYLDNTFINEESVKLYRMFSESFWDEIRVHGRVDPTILAQRSQAGSVTDDERRRLQEYRTLRRSRIGVGCKTPTSPPKHIAPDFVVDGKSMCSVHRCTLCLEGAVIFPDSLPGLAKRMAELRHIEANMSAVAFLESSFGEEMRNTEFALKHYDQQEVASLIAEWEQKIRSGTHRVVDLDGVQRAKA
ncbi:hypothetical protein [Paraburkholderia sp. D1E]|uniref:hypothetical protein n=1 Tax=Paraburkholderia sp. D1E TaxID=3461398 RepID=UPI0040466D5B